MTIAEFSVSGMTAWINDIAQKYLATVRIIDCIPWGSKGGQAIFEIEGSKGRAVYMIKDIKEHPDITSIDMNPPEGGKLRGMVGMSNCAIIRMMLSAGCFLRTRWPMEMARCVSGWRWGPKARSRNCSGNWKKGALTLSC
jgi:hypothetical protein